MKKLHIIFITLIVLIFLSTAINAQQSLNIAVYAVKINKINSIKNKMPIELIKSAKKLASNKKDAFSMININVAKKYTFPVLVKKREDVIFFDLKHHPINLEIDDISIALAFIKIYRNKGLYFAKRSNGKKGIKIEKNIPQDVFQCINPIPKYLSKDYCLRSNPMRFTPASYKGIEIDDLINELGKNGVVFRSDVIKLLEKTIEMTDGIIHKSKLKKGWIAPEVSFKLAPLDNKTKISKGTKILPPLSLGDEYFKKWSIYAVFKDVEKLQGKIPPEVFKAVKNLEMGNAPEKTVKLKSGIIITLKKLYNTIILEPRKKGNSYIDPAMYKLANIMAWQEKGVIFHKTKKGVKKIIPPICNGINSNHCKPERFFGKIEMNDFIRKIGDENNFLTRKNINELYRKMKRQIDELIKTSKKKTGRIMPVVNFKAVKAPFL